MRAELRHRASTTALQTWARTPERVRIVVRRYAAFRRLQALGWRGLGQQVVFVSAVDAPELTRPRVLVMDLDVLQPTRSGGHRRLLEVMRLITESGAEVTFAACNPLEVTSIGWNVPLHSLEASVEEYSKQFPVLVGPEAIATFLNHHGPHLTAVMFSRSGPAVWLLHQVLAAAPRARLVFDSMDAEHVRVLRQTEVETGAPSLQDALPSLRNERLLVEVCDAVIAVTDEDAAALQSLLPPEVKREMSVVPYLHDLAETRAHGDREGAAWDVLFVGGYLHPPNLDAVRWFLEAVVPLLPPIRTAIVGHGLPEDVQRLATAAGATYLGEVASLDELYQTTLVSIAPIRFGAGVKGKVVEAALHGLPVVGTSIGWEGIGVEHGRSGAVADEPEAFASELLRLLGDGQARRAMADASVDWLAAFSRDSYADVVRHALGIPDA